MKAYIVLLGLLTATVKFSAADVFDACDLSYTFNRSSFWLESPYFPENYRPFTACRYKVTAPLDHQVIVNCTIWLPKNETSCTTESLYFARDGNEDLQGAQQVCGNGTASTDSTFRSIVLAYVSNGGSGKFRCKFTAVKQPCDCGWSMSSKVRNSNETKENEYPSMVGLRDLANNGTPAVFCGGAILSHSWILTGTTCTRLQPDVSKLEAIIGAHNLSTIDESRYGARYRIAEIIEHPEYKAKPVVNDIALLRTATTIEWSRGVGPICLPYKARDSYESSYADVIGWGRTIFEGPAVTALRKVTLKIINNRRCQHTYIQQTITIQPSHLCTEDEKGASQTSCSFDFGGPVILVGKRRQVLVGVTSFGNECSNGGSVTSINTRITSYLRWIKRRVSGLCPVKV